MYDLDQSANTKLGNISTRGRVETGANVMIGGLISGSSVKSVLIRALGPTLRQFDLNGVLEDPVLWVFDANGTLIASNDNWQDTQKTEIETSGLAPSNPSEAAMIIMHPVGNMTTMVSGKNNTSGLALVEVYDLDLPWPAASSH